MHYIAHTNFYKLSIPIMHYNVKNVLYSHGFGNKNEYNNIYIHLYNALMEAIEDRSLTENSKLPPTRILAKDLKISRSTVIKAYDLLILEKYAYAIPGSGNYVASAKNKKLKYK